jgi:hypothetical protein
MKLSLYLSVLSFLLLFLLVPVSPVSAQQVVTAEGVTSADSWSENEVQDTTSVKKKDKDKKKDKEKVDEVTITRDFFYSIGLNILSVLLLILLVYYPGNRNSEQIFTFLLFNIIIFIITYVLNQVKISMGAAFGLFAVFSMLRYRTSSISMKDMTYLFLFIALGLINAVHLRYEVMMLLNVFVILITFILDSNILFKPEGSKSIRYDNIDLIRPEHHPELLKDLRERTGLEITRFRIDRVNFLKDTARITVYFKEAAGGIFRRGAKKQK